MLCSRIKLEPPSEHENLASFLRDGIRRNASRTLLADAKHARKWTGAELLDKVERVATSLVRRAHLEPSQVVLTICDHTDHEMILALGVIFAGGAIYGSTPSDSFDEHKDYCRMVRPSVIVSNSNLHQLVMKLKRDLAPQLDDTRLVWIDNPLSSSSSPDDNNNQADCNNNNTPDEQYYSELIREQNVILFEDLLDSERDHSLLDEIIETKIAPKTQNVTFLLTSGSTGRPKVVPNTHEELVWALQAMRCCLKYPVGSNDDDDAGERGEKFILPLNEDSVLAGDLPLDHGAGLNTMFLSLIAGSKLIILPSYNEDSFWQGVHEHRITTSIASTTFTYKLLTRLKQMIKSGEHKRLDLSSFKFITCCGAKLAFQDLVREICALYPHMKIGQAYGCTEIGFISILAAEDCRDHLDSAGHLVPGLVAKVVCPDTGKLLGANQRGQLYLSSMTKFKCYKCLPGDDPTKLFAQCHDQERIFYKTGDYVHFDDEQRIFIHGRMKDTLFLMEDWKILPIELEDVVNQHPLVEYSAVVGVPDPDLPGCDAPKAFVKLIDVRSKEFEELESGGLLREKLLADDREFIAEDIFNFVAERTAKPKHLKGGVRILEVFPRNGLLAKIDRKILKQMD